jgi:hypothetical protein
MKAPTISTAILVFIGTLAYGQDDVPFPLEDAVWHIYLESTCDNDSPPDPFLLRYSFEGDTGVKSFSYGHLYLETGNTIDPSRKSAGCIIRIQWNSNQND